MGWKQTDSEDQWQQHINAIRRYKRCHLARSEQIMSTGASPRIHKLIMDTLNNSPAAVIVIAVLLTTSVSLVAAGGDGDREQYDE